MVILKLVAGLLGLILSLISASFLFGGNENEQNKKKNGCAWLILFLISVMLMGFAGILSFGGGEDPIPMRRP